MPETKTVEELFKDFQDIITSKRTPDEIENLIIHFLNENATDIVGVTYNGKTLLDIAIEKKYSSSIVKLLINYLVDVHAKDSLHIAVKNDDTDVVNVLLENSQSIKLDININKEGEKGLTALDCAKPGSQMYTLLENRGAKYGKKYQYLNALGIKMEDFDEDKLKTDDGYCFDMLEKALNIKDSAYREQVVTWLVKGQGANIDCERYGEALLERSVLSYENNKDELEKLELLLKLGARAISDTTSWEYICSYSCSYSSAIKLMIKYFKHPEINNLLPGIAKISDVNLIKDLLKNKADIVKLQDRDGNTLLHLAIKNNCNPEIVEVLLSNGADPYLTNKNELTALELVAKDKNSDLKTAELLVKKMAEIASSDSYKTLRLKHIINARSDGYSFESKTLLERALLQGNDNLARLLVLAGAREGLFAIKDKNNQILIERSINYYSIAALWHRDCENFINSLIENALETREIPMLQELIKYEVLKGKIIEQITPDYLKKIISEGNTTFLKFLIKHKLLDVNHEVGSKPLLQVACEKNNLPVAKLLIELGADIYAKIEHGYTSVDYVASKGNKEFVELFITATKNHERSKRTELLSNAMGAARHDKSINTLLLLANDVGITCKYEDIISALSAINAQGKTPIDEADKFDLSLYKSYFEEYKGSELRKSLFINLGVTSLVTAGVATFTALSLVALYIAIAVAVIGIACTAYKVHKTPKKLLQLTYLF